MSRDAQGSPQGVPGRAGGPAPSGTPKRRRAQSAGLGGRSPKRSPHPSPSNRLHRASLKLPSQIPLTPSKSAPHVYLRHLGGRSPAPPNSLRDPLTAPIPPSDGPRFFREPTPSIPTGFSRDLDLRNRPQRTSALAPVLYPPPLSRNIPRGRSSDIPAICVRCLLQAPPSETQKPFFKVFPNPLQTWDSPSLPQLETSHGPTICPQTSLSHIPGIFPVTCPHPKRFST